MTISNKNDKHGKWLSLPVPSYHPGRTFQHETRVLKVKSRALYRRLPQFQILFITCTRPVEKILSQSFRRAKRVTDIQQQLNVHTFDKTDRTFDIEPKPILRRISVISTFWKFSVLGTSHTLYILSSDSIFFYFSSFSLHLVRNQRIKVVESWNSVRFPYASRDIQKAQAIISGSYLRRNGGNYIWSFYSFFFPPSIFRPLQIYFTLCYDICAANAIYQNLAQKKK